MTNSDLFTRLQRWYTSQPEHYKAIQSCIDSLGDEQVVVFVRYIDTIPDGAARLTGDMAQKDREAVIDAFRRGNVRVLWITYGLGAYGLNLQNAHNVIFAEQIWDYAQRIQAEARVYRMGQSEKVHIYDIICRNAGLERLIMSNIRHKERTADRVQRSIEYIKESL